MPPRLPKDRKIPPLKSTSVPPSFGDRRGETSRDSSDPRLYGLGSVQRETPPLSVSQSSGMGGSLGGTVLIPGEKKTPETSLAAMIETQFMSKEFNDVFGATELRENEILALAGAMACRMVNLILSTEEEDYEIAPPDQKGMYAQRLALKQRVLTDGNAMSFVLWDIYIYAFGLCRKSLQRKSRGEAVHIGTTSLSRAYAGDDVGWGQQLAAKLGFGQYKTAYVPRREQQ